ncbi:MAG: response regulator [Acidimicrobiales bacterium]
MSYEVSGAKRHTDVLVAEDDAHDQMLFVMAADDSKTDMSVSFVADGEELLGELRKRAASDSLPDVLVLDMRMPRLDGHEVLDVLRDEPTIRPAVVGVFSSSHRQQDIDRSMAKGAAWHKVKPSRYEDLLSFVRQLGSNVMEEARSSN